MLKPYDPETRLKEDRKCEYCGKVFNCGSQGTKTHCSKACRQNHYIARKTGHKPMSREQRNEEALYCFSLKGVHNIQCWPFEIIGPYFILCTLVLVCLFSLALPKTAECSTPSYFNQVVDAIYIVEGGLKAKKPFGILSVPCDGYSDCRKVCYNTVRNNWKRWLNAGKPGVYLDFLADRYCPPSADPQGNINWKKNIRRIVK